MATSRDDFVIAIRSAFLKKGNKQRFSLVALIIFSVVLIVLSRINFPAINYLKIGLNEVVYRVSFIVSLPEQQLNRSLIVINNHLNLYNDHDQLKEKFKSLRGKELDNEYVKFENERLRLAEELVPNQDSKFIYEQHKTADGDSVVTKRPFGGGVETRVQIDPKEEFKKLKWSKNNLVVTKNT